MTRVPAELTDRLLDVRLIYHERDIERFPRAREVLARFPDAERIEVLSHQAIPGLHGNAGAVEDWVRNKREVLVLGEKKSLTARRNGRSSDWIAPSTANGCAMACSYCYVPRRKGYANPITVFANIRAIDKFGRYGGEEFLLILPDATDGAAEQSLDRLRAIVADLDWSAFSPGMTVTISAGVAMLGPNETPDAILARADSALYAAKESGRNRVARA